MMDHDSIFLPLVHQTLPNMGIKVVRTSVGCPWQNGVVVHINRLLKQYLTFYNTARPCGGWGSGGGWKYTESSCPVTPHY
jgi:hypothetical protein